MHELPQKSQKWTVSGFSHTLSFPSTIQIDAPHVKESMPFKNTTGLSSHTADSDRVDRVSDIRVKGDPSPGGCSILSADEEIIPTAIVMKNIPFSVPKPQILALMSSLALPTPYAFNYHHTDGAFRGLAFGNFTTQEETHLVVKTLNGYEIGGRKLKVEYKKQLPAEQRERIEREKAQKRLAAALLNQEEKHQSRLGQLDRSYPDCMSRNGFRNNMYNSEEFNLQDPETFQIYTALVQFREDPTSSVIEVYADETASQRRTIHQLAERMGLICSMPMTGDRKIRISKVGILRNPIATRFLMPQASTLSHCSFYNHYQKTCSLEESPRPRAFWSPGSEPSAHVTQSLDQTLSQSEVISCPPRQQGLNTSPLSFSSLPTSLRAFQPTRHPGHPRTVAGEIQRHKEPAGIEFVRLRTSAGRIAPNGDVDDEEERARKVDELVRDSLT